MTLMHSISMCLVTNRTGMRLLHESLCHIVAIAVALAMDI